MPLDISTHGTCIINFLPGENPGTNSGITVIRIVINLTFEFSYNGLGRTDNTPFTLTDIGPVIIPKSNYINLDILIPIFTRFKSGLYSLFLI